MVFSADDHALVKLLRQEKRYGAKRFIAEFPSKPQTLLRKIDTSRFLRRPRKSRSSYCLRLEV